MSSFNLDVNVLGSVLTTPQRVAIKNSLYRLLVNERLPNIQFWGKIQGTQLDYIIAVTTQLGSNINKTFYWSVDNGITFSKFAPVDEFIRTTSPLINVLFTGNPALKYRDPTKTRKTDDNGEEEQEEEEEEEQEQEEKPDKDKMVVPRRLTELERLAYTVTSIDHDSALAPIGHSYLSPNGVIEIDRTFSGLSVAAAKKLSNYALFRDAESREAAIRIRKQKANNNTEYLDTITTENSKAQVPWSLHADPSGLSVSIRSLLWPGYEYKVEAGSQQYGGGYFGWGQKNEDLHFML